MAGSERDSDLGVEPAGVNPAYAAFQIAKSLITSESHHDAATRERAKQKIATWKTVLDNILSGFVEYGSRTPVDGAPAWTTLEVATGGFATGALLAGGPLQEHELRLLETIPGIPAGEERRALNAFYLTDAGLNELKDRLSTGCYDIAVPEEGALLVVAWLVENGHAAEARALLGTLSPYFGKLRFYPPPLQNVRQFGSRVHLQDVGKTLDDIQSIKPNKRVLAQKRAVGVWVPFVDRIVALFLETVEDGWPCQRYPNRWQERAVGLLNEYARLEKEHERSRKLSRPNAHAVQLLEFLRRCANNPEGLSGREVGRIRLILNRYVEKRGAPSTRTHAEARRRQASDVSAPTFHDIARVVALRLGKYSKEDVLDDVEHLADAVTVSEAAQCGVPEGTSIPANIKRKTARCLNETVQELVARGLITSGDVLARVLPQMTSGLRATAIPDPALRRLYASIYRAFRRRRSLLLYNLEKQVQIGELPWVATIERFRSESMPERELARQTLEEITVLTLTSFPQAILPNKLLQEMRGLVQGAKLDIPLVDELAVDIFMGEFSDKFVEAARRAADLLSGSLYARYYSIDYDDIRKIPTETEHPRRKWFLQTKRRVPDQFAELCASRAGVSLGTWNPATNGMIIEQQHILTTQNLAVLFQGLGLGSELYRLDDLARQCFMWICRRQQMKIHHWHARLIMVKNTAYAWRQMVFFLSLLPEAGVINFLHWAEEYLSTQTHDFRRRFHPVLTGLAVAASGAKMDDESETCADARRFLGWSNTKHWLLSDVDYR